MQCSFVERKKDEKEEKISQQKKDKTSQQKRQPEKNLQFSASLLHEANCLMTAQLQGCELLYPCEERKARTHRLQRHIEKQIPYRETGARSEPYN